MSKGTPSFGKRGKKTLHTVCRRCGKPGYNVKTKICVKCGFGRHPKLRKYKWRQDK